MLAELRAFLISDGPLGSLIGQRVYATVMPQRPTFPAVTYQVISATRTPTMLHGDNLPSKRIQIDAWALSPDAANAVGEVIREALDGFKGAMGESPGVEVAGVFADTERMDYEPETKLHRQSRDFIIWYAEHVEIVN